VCEVRAHVDGPREKRAAHGGRFTHARHDGAMHLLVHARHGVHHRRLDLAQLLGEVIGAARDPRLAAEEQADEQAVDALEDM
jgi:hypothetical protein